MIELLENVVSSVMLIQDFKLENYPVGFKEFEVEKEQNDIAREKQVEEFMRLNRNINCDNPKYKIKTVYEKWINARYERNILLQGKFTFSAPNPLECSEEMDQKDISLIKIENLRFSYNPGTLPFIFDNPISYDIKVGTRVGIMGPNGAGKSTLLKLVTGKLEATEGTITRHPDFVTAYFGQHSTKELDLESSAIDFMQWKFPTANVGVLRSHLAKTAVGDSIADSRMKNLSFSQRSCVIFAALTFVPPHLLIMDEPTNFFGFGFRRFLDQSREQIPRRSCCCNPQQRFPKQNRVNLLVHHPWCFPRIWNHERSRKSDLFLYHRS